MVGLFRLVIAPKCPRVLVFTQSVLCFCPISTCVCVCVCVCICVQLRSIQFHEKSYGWSRDRREDITILIGATHGSERNSKCQKRYLHSSVWDYAPEEYIMLYIMLYLCDSKHNPSRRHYNHPASKENSVLQITLYFVTVFKAGTTEPQPEAVQFSPHPRTQL
jgi:hypothetical protein